MVENTGADADDSGHVKAGQPALNWLQSSDTARSALSLGFPHANLRGLPQQSA